MSFLPGISEMQMETLTWAEQYKHPNWQKKRLEVMQAARFECEICGDKDTTLNVHHKRYVKGRNVWEYGRDELMCLCEPCHEEHHDNVNAFRELTAQLPADGPGCLHNARGLLAGWADGEQGLDFSHHFNEEPFNFLVGGVANLLARACTADDLSALAKAMRARDRYTVRAAIAQLAHDLPNRPAAEPPRSDL